MCKYSTFSLFHIFPILSFEFEFEAGSGNFVAGRFIADHHLGSISVGETKKFKQRQIARKFEFGSAGKSEQFQSDHRFQSSRLFQTKVSRSE